MLTTGVCLSHNAWTWSYKYKYWPCLCHAGWNTNVDHHRKLGAEFAERMVASHHILGSHSKIDNVYLQGQKPIRHSKQGAFQVLDVSEHFKPIT